VPLPSENGSVAAEVLLFAASSRWEPSVPWLVYHIPLAYTWHAMVRINGISLYRWREVGTPLRLSAFDQSGREARDGGKLPLWS
jgi:hypothetical protein